MCLGGWVCMLRAVYPLIYTSDVGMQLNKHKHPVL